MPASNLLHATPGQGAHPSGPCRPYPLPCRSQAHVGGVQRALRPGCRGAVPQHDRRPPDPEFDEEAGRYMDSATPDRGVDLLRRFPNRGPVLVDEAHNFRNINQRSRGLCNYLEAGDHKVVLLSATPQNLGPMDIYRQLTLFLDDTDHGLNLEPVSLEAYFGAAQRWMEYRVDYENYEAEYQVWDNGRPRTAPPLPPTKPAVPRAEIEQALSPVFTLFLDDTDHGLNLDPVSLEAYFGRRTV